jgi:hypothetical protein
MTHPLFKPGDVVLADSRGRIVFAGPSAPAPTPSPSTPSPSAPATWPNGAIGIVESGGDLYLALKHNNQIAFVEATADSGMASTPGQPISHCHRGPSA